MRPRELSVLQTCGVPVTWTTSEKYPKKRKNDINKQTEFSMREREFIRAKKVILCNVFGPHKVHQVIDESAFKHLVTPTELVCLDMQYYGSTLLH